MMDILSFFPRFFFTYIQNTFIIQPSPGQEGVESMKKRIRISLQILHFA